MQGRGREQKKAVKLPSLLLGVVLVLALLPVKAPVLAAAYPAAEEVIVGDFDFSAAPYYKNSGKTGTAANYNVWYNAKTGVLELNGFHGADCLIRNESALPLTIKVMGENTLKVGAGDTASAVGIDSYCGELFFGGDGSFSIEIIGGNPMCYGIGGKRVTVGDRVTMNIVAQSKGDVCGIYAVEGVEIKDNAAVAIDAVSEADSQAGIRTESGEVRFSSEKPIVLRLAGKYVDLKGEPLLPAETGKEPIKNIADLEQARRAEKLLADAPITEKKTALQGLTAETKDILAAALLPQYRDVQANQWYSGDLAVVIAMGLVKGTGASTVSPDRNVTGQQLMAMLVRSMGREVAPITGGDWYIPYKNEAAALKLDEGLRFDLGKDLTRAEVAQMMYQYIKRNEKKALKPDTNVLKRVKDRAEIPAEYQEAAAYMYRQGILKGYEDGSFAPNKKVSRIEVISLMARLLAM